MEKLADSFKNPKISNREQAIFELGIKLATIFHQFVGTPIKNNSETLEAIMKGIEASISCQPYVTNVKVLIQPTIESTKKQNVKANAYDYTIISPSNLSANVEITYKNWRVWGKMEWISELRYPLMYIINIEEI